MSKQRIIFILGIWITLLPFLGFPTSWKNIFFAVSGLFLIYVSYIIHREFKNTLPREKRANTYVESGPIFTEENNLNQNGQSNYQI